VRPKPKSGVVVAFLAAERGRGLSVNTVDLRRAAIRYLHFTAGLAVPTAEAHVAATPAGIHRAAADAGELAPIRVGHIGKRARPAPAPAPLHGRPRRHRHHRGHPARHHRALPGAGAAPLAGAGEDHRGAVFGRIWVPPTRDQPAEGPSPVVGARAIDAGTVARIVKSRAARPVSTATRSAATVSSAARSPPAWTAASTRPGPSSSADKRATPCSTGHSSSATVSAVAVRSQAQPGGAPNRRSKTRSSMAAFVEQGGADEVAQ